MANEYTGGGEYQPGPTYKKPKKKKKPAAKPAWRAKPYAGTGGSRPQDKGLMPDGSRQEDARRAERMKQTPRRTPSRRGFAPPSRSTSPGSMTSNPRGNSSSLDNLLSLGIVGAIKNLQNKNSRARDMGRAAGSRGPSGPSTRRQENEGRVLFPSLPTRRKPSKSKPTPPTGGRPKPDTRDRYPKRKPTPSTGSRPKPDTRDRYPKPPTPRANPNRPYLKKPFASPKSPKRRNNRAVIEK